MSDLVQKEDGIQAAILNTAERENSLDTINNIVVLSSKCQSPGKETSNISLPEEKITAISVATTQKGGNSMHTAESTIIANKRSDIRIALRQIPADLPYTDWFRVGAALKHEGFQFEDFDNWSRTAAHKYDANSARKRKSSSVSSTRGKYFMLESPVVHGCKIARLFLLYKLFFAF